LRNRPRDTSYVLSFFIETRGGHRVAYFVESLCYKPRGRGFYSRLIYWGFQLTYYFHCRVLFPMNLLGFSIDLLFPLSRVGTCLRSRCLAIIKYATVFITVFKKCLPSRCLETAHMSQYIGHSPDRIARQLSSRFNSFMSIMKTGKCSY
jgi:hypothetical protein